MSNIRTAIPVIVVLAGAGLLRGAASAQAPAPAPFSAQASVVPATLPVAVDTVKLQLRQVTTPGLDVARDGGALVFDLLGQIWRMPATGGTAVPLTSALADTAEDHDPALSSDGRSVVFRGERAGRTGLWLIQTARPAPVQLVQAPDAFAWVVDPAWSPDGTRVAFALTRPPDADGNRYEGIATVNVADRAVRALEITGMEGTNLRTPAWTGDGARIAFVAVAEDAPGGWPTGRIWSVAADGGAPTPLTAEDAHALAPAFAPDGGRIAFLSPDSAGRLQLWVQSLGGAYGTATGRAVRLTDDDDVAPTRVRWSGDGAFLVYAADGALRRVPAAGGDVADIPFTADLTIPRTRATLPPARFPEPGAVTEARGFTGLALSPDGRSIAMIALGRLWIVPAEQGAIADGARAVADVPITARYTAWSADGAEVAWSAGPAGEQDVFATDVATGATRRVTALPGNEAYPAYSPDGRWLAFTHAGEEARIRVVAARGDVVSDTSATRDVGAGSIDWTGSDAGAPQWSPQSDALLRDTDWEIGKPTGGALLALTGERTSVMLPDAPTHFRWTRDALVWTRHDRLWAAPFGRSGVAGAPRALGDAPAMYPSVSADGDVLFVSADGLRLRSAAGAEHVLGRPVRYTPPVPEPLLIRNARIIDGTGAPATAAMDVAIVRGRIAAIVPAGTCEGASVGPCAGAVTGAHVLDAAGRYLMPGLIDLHAHVYLPELLPAFLYFGVTLVRDQGAPMAPLAAWADAIAADVVPGPRVSLGAFQYYTDWPFDEESGRGIEPEADPGHIARAVALAGAFGAHHVKLRTFRRWDIAARIIGEAHRLGLRTTGHCTHPLPLVAAGIDAKEHIGSCATRGQARFLGDMRTYDDVDQLMRATSTGVVPTIIYFALAARLAAEPDLLQRDSALAPFLPDPASYGWMARLDSAGRTAFARAAAEARATTGRLARAGVTIGTGTDVWQIPTAVHMELEELVAAGLTPLEALRAATGDAATIAGAADLGTIAVGKLADVVLLDADPTVDIRNTRRIRTVVLGGRVVDRLAIRARFAADRR